MVSKHDLEQEIELAKMMVAAAEQSRTEKIRTTKYKDCSEPANDVEEG